MLPPEIIQQLDQHSEDLPALECDGMSRVVSYLLSQAGIEHTPRIGSLFLALGSSGSASISPHCWVEACGMFIDYRARMWVAEPAERVPHGVFAPTDYLGAVYQGRAINAGDWANHNIYAVLLVAGAPLPPELLASL